MFPDGTEIKLGQREKLPLTVAMPFRRRTISRDKSHSQGVFSPNFLLFGRWKASCRRHGVAKDISRDDLGRRGRPKLGFAFLPISANPKDLPVQSGRPSPFSLPQARPNTSGHQTRAAFSRDNPNELGKNPLTTRSWNFRPRTEHRNCPAASRFHWWQCQGVARLARARFSKMFNNAPPRQSRKCCPPTVRQTRCAVKYVAQDGRARSETVPGRPLR